MKQLKMYLLPEIAVPDFPAPEGYSFSTCRTEEDMRAWAECCRNGSLMDDNADDLKAFGDAILSRPEIVPERDVFFLDYEGKHIATATCYINSEEEGDLHMVGMLPEFRGKGLSKYILRKALCHLNGSAVKFIHLTTDEFRRAAIRSYLDFGFLPVDYDEDMKCRWEQVLYDLGVKSTLMLNDDGTFRGVIYPVKHE